jgi:hypothetical protein
MGKDKILQGVDISLKKNGRLCENQLLLLS